MYLVLALIAFIWIEQRRRSMTTTSAAGGAGGWHGPAKTMLIGGQNIDGNAWDNGTTRPIFNSQWSGYDPPIGNIVFAVDGGQDGQNPAQPIVSLPTTQVTTLGRFQVLGGGDPLRPAVIPPQVSTLNSVVRR